MWLGAGKNGIWGPQPPFWFMCSSHVEFGFGWRKHFHFFFTYNRKKRYGSINLNLWQEDIQAYGRIIFAKSLGRKRRAAADRADA